MIELASFGKQPFLDLGSAPTELGKPLFMFHNYMEHVTSIAYVTDYGQHVYDLPHLLRYLDEDIEVNAAARDKLLQIFFQAGAIINTYPGERVLVSYELGEYITQFEVVGRYSTTPVWINQRERKEFTEIGKLYEYVVSRCNYYS